MFTCPVSLHTFQRAVRPTQNLLCLLELLPHPSPPNIGVSDLELEVTQGEPGTSHSHAVVQTFSPVTAEIRSRPNLTGRAQREELWACPAPKFILTSLNKHSCLPLCRKRHSQPQSNSAPLAKGALCMALKRCPGARTKPEHLRADLWVCTCVFGDPCASRVCVNQRLSSAAHHYILNVPQKHACFWNRQ